MNADKREFYTEVAKSLKVDGYRWQKIVGSLYTRAVRRGDNSTALVTEISEILTSIELKATPDAVRYWVRLAGFVNARDAGRNIVDIWKTEDNEVLEEAQRRRLAEVGRRGIG